MILSSLLSLDIAIIVVFYKTTSLRHPAPEDSLKDYPASAYSKVGQLCSLIYSSAILTVF